MEKNQSKGRSRSYHNFNMTLEECRLIFDTMENLVITDKDGYIKYLSPSMYFMIEAYNKRPVPKSVVGRHIDEIHPISKVTNALKSGGSYKNCFYFSSDVTNIVRIEPLYKDSELVGAIDYDIFTDGKELKEFLDDVKECGILSRDGRVKRRRKKPASSEAPDDLIEKSKRTWEKNKEIDNFDMTVDECLVVLDSIENLVVTDEEGRIKYFSPDMYSLIERYDHIRLPEDVTGRYIKDMHVHSLVMETLETGRTNKNCFYFYDDVTNISRIEPIYRNGVLVGAMDYDLFTNKKELEEFLSDVDKYSAKGFLNLENTFESMYESVRRDNKVKYSIDDFIGKSKAALALRKQITNLSEANSTVLITGKTGSGKELVAHSIHNTSRRCQYPIIEVNCAAIPENLVESELFGYEEGSFTGAKQGGRTGFFERADKGTIFLDEVDQLPYHVQPKLLRVLQEREVTRIGGDTVPIDVRVLSATNKNLQDMVNEGKFREDLYYRLNVVEVNIPPLAERKEDIPLLADYQLKRLNRQMVKDVKNISDEAMRLFLSYDWPGNVRELNNLLERSIILCQGDVLGLEHLGNFITRVMEGQTDLFLSFDNPLEEIRMRAEKSAIAKTLEMTGGNRTRAAGMLKISRTALYDKMRKYNLL